MQIEAAKKYVVEVYSDQGSFNDKLWSTLGEFIELEHAVDACKSVVDNFFMRSPFLKTGADLLINHFLNYGDVPCIKGGGNLSRFDIYEYLNTRCNEP